MRYQRLFSIFFVFAVVVGVLSFVVSLPQVKAMTSTDFDRININGEVGRVAIADIDGDGKRDIILHRWARSRATAGQKTNLSWYKYPSMAETVIASDFFFGDDVESYDIDGDGDNDVIAHVTNGSNRDEVTVKVFRQNSPTSWQPVTVGYHNGGSEIRDFSIKDFDKDGKLDIMARYARQLVIWYQDSPTSYVKKVVHNMGSFTGSAAEGLDVMDVDGDGKTDAILEGYWLKNAGGRNTGWQRYIFDPSWHTDEAAGYMGYSVKVKVADMDGDGKEDDFLLSDSENNDQPIIWYTLKSGANPTAGAGSFQKTTVDSRTGFFAHTLQVGDFDGDCDMDVMSGGLPKAKTDNYNVTIYLNNGNGGSFEKKTLAGTGTTYSGKVGDLDNDGVPDMVIPAGWDVSENSGSKLPPEKVQVKIFTNKKGTCSGGGGNPPASLDSWERHLISGSMGRSTYAVWGDFDGDNKLDLAAGNSWYKNPGSLGGNWAKRTIVNGFGDVALAHDFDGDGDIDVFGAKNAPQSGSTNQLVWAENNGSGSFTLKNNVSSSGAGDFLQGVALANFGSGNQIIMSWHRGGNGVQAISIPGSPRTQNWGISTLSTTTQNEDLSVGNINRTGGLDILLGTKWLKNNGTSWQPFTLGSVENGTPDRSDLADINGDGRLDAVVALENGTQVYWYQAPANPEGNWTRKNIGTAAGQGFSMDTADFDGDGDPDVVLGEHRGQSQNRVIIFENKNNGGSWQQHVIDSGPKTEIDHHDGTQAVDLDRDGDLDIVSLGWTNPKLWVYENTSDTGSPNPTPTDRPNEPCNKTADINGNGRVDIRDYTTLIQAYGSTASSSDLNCDGRVTIIDYSILIQAFATQPAPVATATPRPIGGGQGDEVLLFDKSGIRFYDPTRPEADRWWTKGFYPLITHTNDNDHGPDNWKSPVDYWDGQFQVRYIIEQQASGAKGKLQTCIWNMRPQNWRPETCSSQVSYDGVGDVMYNSAPYPNGVENGGNGQRPDGRNIGWFRLHGVIDYAQPENFMIRAVLRGESGCNVMPYSGSNTCWDQRDKYEGLVFRETIILVPAGKEFSGWQNYP